LATLYQTTSLVPVFQIIMLVPLYKNVMLVLAYQPVSYNVTQKSNFHMTLQELSNSLAVG